MEGASFRRTYSSYVSFCTPGSLRLHCRADDLLHRALAVTLSVPRKPNPTGLNNFVLAGASGLVLDFELYQGAGTFDRYDIHGKKAGQGPGAVLRLCESLSNGHRLYCDRFFTSLPLINHMLTKGVYVTGTITKCYLLVTFTDDRAMVKVGRGTSEQYVSTSPF